MSKATTQSFSALLKKKPAPLSDNDFADGRSDAWATSGSFAVTNPTVGPQVASGSGKAELPVSFPTTDWIAYIKSQVAGGDPFTFQCGARDSGVLSISFNFDWVTGTEQPGVVSGVFMGQPFALYANATTLDIAAHYDANNQALSVYERTVDNHWVMLARVAGAAAPAFAFTLFSGGGATAIASIDHLKLCYPNFIAIGDSICAGEPGFDPDPSLNRNDYNSAWQAACNLPVSLLNSLILNKGVGGNYSHQINGRIDSFVTSHRPQVVFLHLSTNDGRNATGYSIRTAYTQDSIDRCAGAGAKVVLINSVYSAQNQAWADYYRNYLSDPEGLPSLSKYWRFVDIMQGLKDGATGNIAAQYDSGDGTHLSVLGYQKLGEQVRDVVGTPTGETLSFNVSEVIDFPAGLSVGGVRIQPPKDGGALPYGWVVVGWDAELDDFVIEMASTNPENTAILGVSKHPTYDHWLQLEMRDVKKEISTFSAFGANTSHQGLATFNETVYQGGNRRVSYSLWEIQVPGGLVPIDAAKRSGMRWFISY